MRAGVSRLMAMSMVISIIVIAGVLGGGTSAAACSCARPSPTEAFADADAVFIGKITEIRRPGSMLLREQEARYIFAVDMVFKGEVFERQSIVTNSQGSSCGLELDGPGPFLMFGTVSGFGGPSPDKGEFASALCSGNARVGPDFAADDFGEGVAPLSGSSPSGDAGLSTVAWGGLGAAALLAGILGLLARGRLRHRSANAGLAI